MSNWLDYAETIYYQDKKRQHDDPQIDGLRRDILAEKLYFLQDKRRDRELAFREREAALENVMLSDPRARRILAWIVTAPIIACCVAIGGWFLFWVIVALMVAFK